MSDINEYDFTRDLEKVYNEIASISDEMKSEGMAFRLPTDKQFTTENVKHLASKRFYELSRDLDKQLAVLEDLVDTAIASYRLYEDAMDKEAEKRAALEFESSIGDPNGLRGEDQAVS